MNFLWAVDWGEQGWGESTLEVIGEGTGEHLGALRGNGDGPALGGSGEGKLSGLLGAPREALWQSFRGLGPWGDTGSFCEH